MKIYEVIFWGSHGKADELDTIYLVRAPDHVSAVEFVQRNASPSNHNGAHSPLADIVYELGVDTSASTGSISEILRGPSFASAFNRGWKSWLRGKADSASEEIWVECSPHG